eukprot:COSAG05_NODE_1430_length_4910_cov_1.788609_6_plen_55_part_00
MDHGALMEMPACDLWRGRGVWAGGSVVGSLTRRVAVWCGVRGVDPDSFHRVCTG